MSDTLTLDDVRGRIKDRSKKLHEIFEQAGDGMDMSKVSVIDGDNDTKVAEIRKLNDELTDLGKQRDDLEGLAKIKAEAESLAEIEAAPIHPTKGRKDREREAKSLFDLFYEAAGIDTAAEGRVDVHALKGRTFDLDYDVKALFQTSEGWEPEVTRTGRLVEKEMQPIDALDVIPTGSTGQTAVKYMKETVAENGAKEIAEGGKYPEAKLELDEAESPVRKIAVWLPVTDEQLEDIPQAQGYINRRLPLFLRQRMQSQALAGDGTAVNLRGLLETEGILTQAKGADSTPDAIYKAFVNVEVDGRATPGPLLIHPRDWQEIRLLRTADGIYIWGSPAETGPESVFAHRVVKSTAIAEGTALTGDFANYTELAYRRGIEMKVSDSHAEHFIEGKQAIRADVRVALVVYRPKALCEITGI